MPGRIRVTRRRGPIERAVVTPEPMQVDNDLVEYVWRFIRGDASGSDFEAWLAEADGFRAVVGDAAFQRSVGTDFADARSVETLREALAGHMRTLPSASCFCIRLCDEDVVDMGRFHAKEPAFEERTAGWSSEDVMGPLEPKAERIMAMHSVEARVCRACGQGWLVGVDSIHSDLYCLRRLRAEQLQSILNAEEWPRDFETLESVLQMGEAAGRRAIFCSVEDSMLYECVVELARARPGIPIWTIGVLLNLRPLVAAELGRHAIDDAGVCIEFEPVRAKTRTT